MFWTVWAPVSYTHLDVYKRQVHGFPGFARTQKRIQRAEVVTLIMTLLGGFLDFFSQLQIVCLLYGNLFCELALFFRKGEAERCV